MSKRVSISVIAVFITLSISSISAKNFYVAKSGDDANSGIAEKPFLTIQKAVDVIGEGDSVFVDTGTYNEKITIKDKAGYKDNRIVIKAKNRRKSKIVNNTFMLISNSSYVTVQGFEINITPAGSNDGIDIEKNSQFIEIIDNYLFECEVGVYCDYKTMKDAEGLYIADNKMFKCKSGLFIMGNNWIVERNEVEKLIQYNNDGDCDYSRAFGNDGVFRKNYFHGSIETETGSAHVDGLQSYDANVGLTYLHNMIIDSNRIFDSDQGILLDGTVQGISDSVMIKNNIFCRQWNQGIAVHSIGNVRIINNTFNRGELTREGGWWAIAIDGDKSKGCVIKNNIFYNYIKSSYSVDVAVVHDYNLFYNSVIPSDLGEHDIVNKDPMFVDPASDNYQLKKGSPAIDAGEPLQLGPTDPGLKVDIGACEYVLGVNTNSNYEKKNIVTPNKKSNLMFLEKSQHGANARDLNLFTISGRLVNRKKQGTSLSDIHMSRGIYIFESH
jgi:hypothetical protein